MSALGGYAAGATTASSIASGPLFVSQSASCSDSAGLGSAAVPFCTICAAVNMVEPGQTVMVEPGTYNESVSITRSGTADAPITLQGVPTQAGSPVYVNPAGRAAGFDVTGAQHIVIKGFQPSGEYAAAFSIGSSSDITLDSDVATSYKEPGIHVTGASSGVAVTRTAVLTQYSAGVEVDGGSTGTVLASDQVNRTRPTSTALGSHHGASLEDRGPARFAASVRAPISRPMAAPAQSRYANLVPALRRLLGRAKHLSQSLVGLLHLGRYRPSSSCTSLARP
ncbi:hypothetical protein [Actinacidiphila oryziradicis]|uniref:hypothetical protein n=1 Tax=Actinacidiphila oryziradicis TaxID=2571141 RepID=UPI00145FA664|nr:hypothetical protein [Actinacidiphila oryziradicis]